MGSGEPTLVPEWLREGKGGRSPNANSDDNGIGILSRNRFPLIPRGRDSRKSSKGSEAYNNFGRRDRKKDNNPPCDRDRERSLSGNVGSQDYRNSITSSRTDSDRPWHNNHAGVLGRHRELWPKKPESDPRSVVLPTSQSVSSGGGIRRSSSFKRDFPVLASVDKKGGLEVDKVSSAAESIALPTAAGDRWTSVLAEVPVVVGDSVSTAHVSPVSLPRSNSAGLNMAEALIHASSRAPTVPQLSSDASRAEELTLRQCMQLIPVMPSMPKTSGLHQGSHVGGRKGNGWFIDLENEFMNGLNSSEKSKFRGTTKNGHYGPTRSSQQLSPQLLAVNNALRASAARSDAPKESQIGNFQVLCREKTGVISPLAANDAGTQDVISKSSINPNVKADNKGTNKSLLSSSKSGLGSFQDRSDFFNSIRKKTSVNHSVAAVPEPNCCDTMEKSLSGEQNSGTSADIAIINPDEEWGNGCSAEASVNEEGDHAEGLSTDASVVNKEENAGESGATCGDGADASSVEKLLDMSSRDVIGNDQSSCCSDFNCHLVVDLDERDKAFLRSLGWEEDAPEEALTEEEIATFVKQYEKVRPLSQVLQSLRSC